MIIATSGYVAGSDIKSTKTREKTKDRRGDRNTSSGAIGFIIVSNGRHDFPVAHWSLDRLPPSHQVTIKRSDNGQGEPTDIKPARLYKLDALAYAAEDDKGEMIGQSGQLPGLIVGLPHSLDKYAGQIASAVARPVNPQATDFDGENAKHEVERSHDEPPNLALNDEGGWKSLKDRYADTFGPLLDHLRKRAARTWELQDLIRKFGEGILAGTTHRVALLSEASIEVMGPGARYVRANIEENGAGSSSLVLQAADVALQQEADLDVVVKYGNGESEKLRFFVVSRNVPSNTKAEQSLQRQESED